MGLDLEIIGAVRDLDAEERPERPKVVLKKVKDSHHAVAKLYARGLTDAQVSLQTGYSLPRLSVLKRDPSFAELLKAYHRDDDQVAMDVEAYFLMVGRDALQALHERIMDDDEEAIPEEVLRKTAVDLFDRAGYAPIQRSINKNLNMNIGDRLDAARARALPRQAKDDK